MNISERMIELAAIDKEKRAKKQSAEDGDMTEFDKDYKEYAERSGEKKKKKEGKEADQ